MAVREVIHAFLTADRPEEVYQFALERVSPLVGATFASVYLVDGASELMRLGGAVQLAATIPTVAGRGTRATRVRTER